MVSDQEFRRDLKTGDIILFKAKDRLVATIQRVFSNSDYDHVGILVKIPGHMLEGVPDDEHKIMVYEALGNTGVGFCNWDSFVSHKWYKGYSKLAWRKLECDRTPELLDQMYNFFMENNKKKYALNGDKLIRQQSVIGDDGKLQKKETFFCSELVARFLKELGFLDKKVSSTQYWPVTFS